MSDKDNAYFQNMFDKDNTYFQNKALVVLWYNIATVKNI